MLSGVCVVARIRGRDEFAEWDGLFIYTENNSPIPLFSPTRYHHNTHFFKKRLTRENERNTR
jgi:hypothetical protein